MSGTLLWVTHVPLRNVGGQWLLDVQTCNLLKSLYREFDRIIFGAIHWQDPPTDILTGWQAIATLPWGNQLELLPLPCAYKPLTFIQHYRTVRSQLRQAIQQADYLCFLPSAIVGDWAGVGCLEAIALKRPYATWNDRVERDVILNSISTDPVWKRWIWRLIASATHHYNHWLMQRATLGLLQGQSCFTEFGRDFSRAHQAVHCFNYINTQPGEAIQPEELAAKLRSLPLDPADQVPLKLGYVGRAVEMKGPLDWLITLAHLRDRGIPFEATWVGDGPLLETMQQQRQALGLDSQVHLVGAICDRQALLTLTKTFHVILCCHLTAESARCLQEALVCGCSIVAYHSAYVAGIIEQHHCGTTAPLGNPEALADALSQLYRKPKRLQTWIQAATTAGASLDAEATFRQVGQLIRQYLSQPSPPSQPLFNPFEVGI